MTSEACSLLEEHVSPPETQREEEEEEVTPGCVCSDLGRLAKRPSAIILNSGKRTKMEVRLLLLRGKGRAAAAKSDSIRMSCKDNYEEAQKIRPELCQPR